MKILTESAERLMLDLPIRLRHLHSTYFVTAYYPLSKILPVISKRFNLTPEEEAFLTEKWFEYFYKRVCGKGLSANKQKEFFKQWNHDGQKIPDKLAQVLESLIILENPTEYFRCNIRKENSPYRFEADRIQHSQSQTDDNDKNNEIDLSLQHGRWLSAACLLHKNHIIRMKKSHISSDTKITQD